MSWPIALIGSFELELNSNIWVVLHHCVRRKVYTQQVLHVAFCTPLSSALCEMVDHSWFVHRIAAIRVILYKNDADDINFVYFRFPIIEEGAWWQGILQARSPKSFYHWQQWPNEESIKNYLARIWKVPLCFPHSPTSMEVGNVSDWDVLMYI